MDIETMLAHFLAGLTYGWGDRVTPLYPPPSPVLARVAVALSSLPLARTWAQQRNALASGGSIEIRDPDGPWYLQVGQHGVLTLLAPGKTVAPRTVLGGA